MAGSSDSELQGLEAWLHDVLGECPSFKGVTYYEEYRAVLGDLTRFRNIVELGVAEGASLLAWARLAPLAVCSGFDLDPPARLEQTIIDLGFTEQGTGVPRRSERSTDDLAARMGAPDLIVDDASHLLNQTRTTFRRLFPALAPGGCTASRTGPLATGRASGVPRRVCTGCSTKSSTKSRWKTALNRRQKGRGSPYGRRFRSGN